MCLTLEEFLISQLNITISPHLTSQESIADVASIFAEFYQELDVPPSDLAAGFVLLSKYQAAQRKYLIKNKIFGIEQFLSSVPITPETKFLDTSTAEDSHLINDLIYYMNYALATFGWPLHLIENPCIYCCVCPYLSPLKCCGGMRKKRPKIAVNQDNKVKDNDKDKQQKDETKEQSQQQKDDDKNEQKINQAQSEQIGLKTHEDKAHGSKYEDFDGPIILGDNCFGCNVASVENRLSAHNYEIIYVSYKVNVNIVPFLVVADHSKQTIVVAIRGSMSLSDMVTDLNGQTEKLPFEDCPDDWISHRGITKAALYVKSKLFQEYILEHAFNCRLDLGSQEYNLVLCGHSLGAGAAAILGILLRKQYPTLKAYLYSPPGGLLSLPVVEYTKEFATGIVLGNDCVPRLGFAQLERLRYQVLLTLKRSPRSAGKVIAKALCPTVCLGGNKVDYDPEHSLDVLYGNKGRTFDYNGNKVMFQVQPQMLYVPGRMIHIVKNFTFRSKARRLFNEPIYQAVWMDNTSYDRIMVNEGMFYDHLPNILMHAMKMLFCSTLPARKESKTSTAETLDNTVTDKVKNDIKKLDAKDLKTVHVIAELAERASINSDEDVNNSHLDENNNNDDNGGCKQKGNEVTYPDLNKNLPSKKMYFNDIESKSKYKLDVNGNDEATFNRNHEHH